MRTLFGSLAAICTIVAAGAAYAADMRPAFKASPKPVAAVYDWTGFYLGAHGGWAWTDKRWTDPFANESLVSDNGVGGGQIGFNWQTGAWVFGVEADASWTHIRKGWIDPEPEPLRFRPIFGTSVTRVGVTVDHFGTIAGRIGYAFNNWLVFAKGGVAWANDIYRATNEVTDTLLASTRGTRWGGMAGAGLEYGFAPNWSAKVEFDYLFLGTRSITYVSVPGVTPASRTFNVEQEIAVVKAGINYRFSAR